jgi:hypothetical protein
VTIVLPRASGAQGGCAALAAPAENREASAAGRSEVPSQAPRRRNDEPTSAWQCQR